jgi:hypothetical protein
MREGPPRAFPADPVGVRSWMGSSASTAVVTLRSRARRREANTRLFGRPVLALSGMRDPAKVLGFPDFAGGGETRVSLSFSQGRLAFRRSALGSRRGCRSRCCFLASRCQQSKTRWPSRRRHRVVRHQLARTSAPAGPSAVWSLACPRHLVRPRRAFRHAAPPFHGRARAGVAQSLTVAWAMTPARRNRRRGIRIMGRPVGSDFGVLASVR